MTQPSQPDMTSASPAVVHRGSAPMTLSGRAVILVWLASFGFHLLGLALMVLMVFPFTSRTVVPPPPSRVELVGPVDPVQVATVPSLELSSGEPTTDPVAEVIKPSRTSSLDDLSLSKRPDLTIMGIGSGGGDFSSYGLQAGGGGGGPQFFGLGGSVRGARRIVYVVDRSGSMLDTFDHVRRELVRSIDALRRSQKFHVIFFNAGVPLENPPRRLVSAIRAQKKALGEFLDTVFPAGSTKPAQALRRAMSLEPDLIYFLTDGAFDPALLDKLDKWNPSRKVRIFTIAFFDRSGAELLERIAREHDGEFKFVSETDVN
ncbi:MAG: vWA domain-containing protein [Phycisphaerae bacterium]